MIKVAVIGLGKMGLLHASILNVLPCVDLIAICEKNSVVRRFSKPVLGKVKIVSQVNQLTGLDLDAVYVTTPVTSHYGIVKEIYSKGIARNIFVEKPLAASYEQADELCRLSEYYGGIHFVGYNRRFAVTFNKARSMVEHGDLGEVDSFEVYAFSSDFSGGTDTSRQSMSRGGVITDLGCHAIDLALWFFGDIEVQSAEIKSVNDSGSEDSAQFKSITKEGLPGYFNISWCMEQYRLPEIGMLLKGSKATIRVDEDRVEFTSNEDMTFTWYKVDLGDEVSFFLGGADYLRESELFIKSIADGRRSEPDFHSALKVDEIVDRVRQRA